MADAETAPTSPIAVLAAAGVFERAPFALVDVGASGGIEKKWRLLGEHFTGFGLDPAIEESKRQDEAEQTMPGTFRFEAVAAAGALPPVAPRAYSTYPLRRLAAEETLQRQNRLMYDNQLKPDAFVEGYQPGDMTDRGDGKVDLSARLNASLPRWAGAPQTLDRFLEARNSDLDFLKIDVDGADFAVLCGAERALQLCPVMGVQIEANFQGHGDADANTFTNIDNFLRARGFALFGMVGPLRYARRDLPLPFLNDFPSESQHGQVIWADALYLRDLAHPKYFEHFPIKIDLSKLAKLIAIAHLFDLDDFALELVNCYAKALAERLDVEALKQALAQRHYPGRALGDVLNEFYGQ